MSRDAHQVVSLTLGEHGIDFSFNKVLEYLTAQRGNIAGDVVTAITLKSARFVQKSLGQREVVRPSRRFLSFGHIGIKATWDSGSNRFASVEPARVWMGSCLFQGALSASG